MIVGQESKLLEETFKSLLKILGFCRNILSISILKENSEDSVKEVVIY